MRMNDPIGKAILAMIRKSDYAHAGEEEAIDLVFCNIPKDPARMILDVGCGRGGTADYVYRKGWGNVCGVDIDSESIEHAKKTYPDIEFTATDVELISKKISKRFDMIYLFNSFYAFKDQHCALMQMNEVSTEKGQLIVFDYVNHIRDQNKVPFINWNPLVLNNIKTSFSDSGWNIENVKDVGNCYKKWYSNLVSKIEARSDEIIQLSDEEWFRYVKDFYQKVYDSISEGIIGGAIVYAVKK